MTPSTIAAPEIGIATASSAVMTRTGGVGATGASPVIRVFAISVPLALLDPFIEEPMQFHGVPAPEGRAGAPEEPDPPGYGPFG